MELAKIKNGVATLDPVDHVLIGLLPESLTDLSWCDPALGFKNTAWWPIEDQNPAFDPATQYLGDSYTLILDTNRKVVVRSREVLAYSKDAITAARMVDVISMANKVKTERDGPRTEGGVLVNGMWFHTDSASRIKWLGLKDSARDIQTANSPMSTIIVVDGTEVQWKTMSGGFVPVTAQLAFDVVEATKVLDKKLFVIAEFHIQTLSKLTDPKTYDFSKNWPARYIDITK